mgnify:CR=1 FL=1
MKKLLATLLLGVGLAFGGLNAVAQTTTEAPAAVAAPAADAAAATQAATGRPAATAAGRYEFAFLARDPERGDARVSAWVEDDCGLVAVARVDAMPLDDPQLQPDLVIEFAADGIRRLAEIAWQVNEKTENIGARRLHTLLERLLEEVSFSAGDLANSQAEAIQIDAAYVNSHLGELAQDEDLSRYIL